MRVPKASTPAKLYPRQRPALPCRVTTTTIAGSMSRLYAPLETSEDAPQVDVARRYMQPRLRAIIIGMCVLFALVMACLLALGIVGQNAQNGSGGHCEGQCHNGTDGAPGQNGTCTTPCVNGTDGAPGQNGTCTQPCVNGTDGAPGQNGTCTQPCVNGTQGPQGPPGQNGTCTAPCVNGTQGPPGTPGAPGQNGTCTEPCVNGTQGPQGPPGQNGTCTAPCVNGTQGPPGTPGQNGTCTEPCVNGTQGPQGPTGPPGAPGQNGSCSGLCVNGTQGPQGPQGPPGANGTCGCNGTLGIYTINSLNPDGDLNFNIGAGAGIGITPGSSLITVSALVPDPVATINSVAPNASHNIDLVPGQNIVITPGTNNITIAVSADVANPITTINNVAPNASHNFALQGANHVLVTSITNGQLLSTDGTPYNNASTLVARDGDGGFEASVITATAFVAHTNGSRVFELWGTGDVNPRFDIDEWGTLEWGPGDSGRDIELSRDGPATLQLLSNLRMNGWLQVGSFFDSTPTNDAEGDVTCKRLRAWPYQIHDAWPLGNGPNGAFVNMTGTMTLTNTSGPFAPGAVGFLAQYEVQPSTVQDTTGTFVSGALTLVFAGDTDMTGTAVGGRAAVQVTGKAAAGALVGLDATVRVASDRQSWGVVTNIAVVGTTSGYTVGTYVGITGCGGTGAIFEVQAPLGPSNSIANFQIVAGGHSYSSSGNCACTILNGTGSAVVVNLTLIANAQYQQVVGVRAQAFDASQSYGYMRPIDLAGVLVQQSYLSLNATYPSGTLTQRGVYVQPQLLGQQYNAAFWADALTGNTSQGNYGLYLVGGSGNSSNYGVWVGQQGLSGAGSLNVGAQIAPPATGATGSAALRLQADQSTAAVGGILWGSGSDSPNANLYRSAAGTLKTDGSLVITLDMSARTMTAQQFRALPPNTTDVTFLTRLSGDVDNRLQLTGDGVLKWGDGTTAADTNLYRVSAQRLQTDQSLTVAVNARVGTYALVGSTSAPLNTATGDLSATRLMLGSEFALGEPGFSTTLAVVGTVANANASSSTVTTSCGSNTTIVLSPGSVTSGSLMASEVALQMAGDTAITGTGYGERVATKLARAGGGAFVALDVSNRVTTNVPSTTGLLGVAVTAGGTGYTVGNQLTVTGGGGSGGTVLVATVSSGVVTAVTMERPGSGYSVGTGRATTGGSGSGCTINIQSVGSTTYTTLNGAQFTAYSASGTYATPTLPATVRGVLINDIDLGSSGQIARPATQLGLGIAAQLQGSTSNIGALILGGTSAVTGITNTGLQVNGGSSTGGFNNGILVSGASGAGTSTVNRGIVLTAQTGTNATNYGVQVVSPTGSGSAINVGVLISQPSGGTGLQQALWMNTQATTASAGILFGDNSDSPSANLYRGAASQVKCDGDLRARHFMGSGSAPSASGGTGAGTGPTIVTGGTDTSFSVSVTAGTTPSSSAKVFTVTYAVAYSQIVYPVFAPVTSTAGALAGAYIDIATVSASGFDFKVGASALSAGQSYQWNFKV